jgi:hypothetical protein
MARRQRPKEVGSNTLLRQIYGGDQGKLNDTPYS